MNKNKTIYDVIIIGTGPAGLTAGLYAARRTLKTLVIGKDLGGQAALSYEVENYPGIEKIAGFSLMKKFVDQAKQFGAVVKFNEVVDIKRQEKDFLIVTKSQTYQGRALILACGLQPRNLDIKGEKKFVGKGISYCATCDASFYKGKIVAVIGGGNAALDAAELLTKIAKKVYLVHRRDEFRGEEIVVNRLKKNPRLEMILSSEIREIKGEKLVESMVVKDNGSNKVKELKVEGIFVEIGYIPKTEVFRKMVKLNKKGEIVTNKAAETSVKGIFAAGDVTDCSYKQIVISAGEGAKAALQAYKYLCLRRGEKIVPDWH